MNDKAPDADLHYNPEPAYLLHMINSTRLTQREVARRLGISERALRYYLSDGDDHRPAPYCVQLGLEVLAGLTLLEQRGQKR